MVTSSASRINHVPALDGLRGVAVVMVMLHHFVAADPMGGRFHQLLVKATGFMWIGVDFFVLSGFVITNILIKTLSSPSYFTSFYGRRVLRIFPLYYTAILLLYIAARSVILPATVSTPYRLWPLLTYTTNFELISSGWQSPWVTHFWSLAIEEQYYLLWPLILWLLPPRKHASFIVLSLGLLFIIRTLMVGYDVQVLTLYLNTITHSDGLLLGSLIAITVRNEKGPMHRLADSIGKHTTLWTAGLLLTLFACVAAGAFERDYWSQLHRILMFTITAVSCSTMLTIAMTSARGRAYRVLTSRSLTVAGLYSYGLYIWHVPIKNIVLAYLPQPQVQWSWCADIYYITAMFFWSGIAAWLSWHLLEKHFLKLKRYFDYQSSTGLIPAS